MKNNKDIKKEDPVLKYVTEIINEGDKNEGMIKVSKMIDILRRSCDLYFKNGWFSAMNDEGVRRFIRNLKEKDAYGKNKI